MAGELLELGVLFAALALVGSAAAVIRQSVIPLYILVGLAVSPSVAGVLSDRYLGRELAVGVSTEVDHFVELGAELGIVFLLFFLGLEFNLDRLLGDWGRIGRAGGVDLAVNFGVGFVLGYTLFGAVLPAYIVAGMVYISSSAIITKSLIDLGWIANQESSPILGTLVFEDLVIAVYLAVLSALVAGSGDLVDAGISIGTAMAFILGLLLVVQFGTPLFRRVVATDSKEFIVLRVAGVTVLIAGFSLWIGVSEAVAAFFVGMGFSTAENIEELEGLLEPVRDVFAAVFFFWIGLVTDPSLFGPVVGIVAAAVVVTTPTKLVSGFWGGKMYGLSDRRATRVGLGMVIRGEFTLIIAAFVLTSAGSAAGSGISAELANELNAFAVGYVLAMSVLGTTLMQYSGSFERVVADIRGESL